MPAPSFNVVAVLLDGGRINVFDGASMGSLRNRNNELVTRLHVRCIEQFVEAGWIERKHDSLAAEESSLTVYVAALTH